MEIIPVMDILDGNVVNAARGKRSEYKPLKSVIVNSFDPLVVSSAFKNLGFKKLYIADLDAIMKKGDNVSIIARIASETGLKLLVDMGIEDMAKAEQLFENKVANVIVGTETLSDLNFLKQIIKFYGKEKIIVSLDLMSRKILTKAESLKSQNAVAAAMIMEDLGFDKIIVLDLARVGSGEGLDLDLLTEMRNRVRMKILVGGGVRDITDLLTLKNLGIDSVLLATALHSGKITVGAVQKGNFH
jgi:phosphoribosylformimino-5-aminoimidazole carboxamide ribotide isomerase